MHRNDYRIASMATVPARRKELPQTIKSLLPQVDEVCVYLNGHTVVPDCVRNSRVTYALSTEHGDRGDGGKFFWADRFPEHSWRLTCDDDFHYVAGYVDAQVEAAMRLESVVSLHGVVLSPELAAGGQDIDWLKRGRAKWVRAIDHVIKDVPVHIVGTGVACYHTSMVQVSADDFLMPHSADIWFSHLCQEQSARKHVWAHPPKLAQQICPPLTHGPKELRWSGEYSKRVASRAPWKLHTET